MENENTIQVQAPTYCPRCRHYSSNMSIHNCRTVFLIMADEAYRAGNHTKVAEIVADAKAQGIDLMQPAWRIPIQIDPTLPDDTIKMGDATLTNIKKD